MVKARVEKLCTALAEADVDALLVTNPSNRMYLTGFTGSFGMVLVAGGEVWLFTDFRYMQQAQQEAPGVNLVLTARDMERRIGEVLIEQGVARLGFEGHHATHAAVAAWHKAWDCQLESLAGTVEELRSVKDERELGTIERAVSITDAAFEGALPFIQPGVSELEVARQLTHAVLGFGGEGMAFDTIVASGPRSALPHGRASDRVIQRGDLVTVDMGSVFEGYASDMTRTVVVGDPDGRQRELYALVLAAQRAGLEALEPGITGAAADRVARDVIDGAGYGDCFGHGLGHGVGLDVHEKPTLSRHGHDDVLAAGMVVTVEPGIYIEGWGGIRIEDTVVITARGSRVLTKTSKELLQL